jgi:Holliday junction resolvase RusA-like endonuclease
MDKQLSPHTRTRLITRDGKKVREMRNITITIDHLPYAELNPNKRLHWSVRSAASKIAREEIGWLCKSQWHDDQPMMKARISYEFLLKGNRTRDIDNLLAACKPFTDGLIDAGVIFYDDCKHLEYGLLRAVHDVKDQTTITVEERE